MSINEEALAFTDADLEELRGVLRAYLADRAPETFVREVMVAESWNAGGLWAGLERELGVLSLLAAPGNLPGLAILAGELGRASFPGPFLGTTVAAAQALLNSRTDSWCAETAAGVCAGTTIATMALGSNARAELGATKTGEGWVLDGEVLNLVDAPIADVLVVRAVVDGQSVLFAVPRHNSLTVIPVATLDQTRRHGNVMFSSTPAHLIVEAADFDAFCAGVESQARALLAAEQAGGAEFMLELSVEYAKTRHQFGRPIGSFQAIKHRCADMFVRVQGARAIAESAAALAANPTTQGDPLVPAATSYCQEAFISACEDSVQIHGGIGFTWEHPAHLYLKRARGAQALFGSPVESRAKVMSQLDAAVSS